MLTPHKNFFSISPSFYITNSWSHHPHKYSLSTSPIFLLRNKNFVLWNKFIRPTICFRHPLFFPPSFLWSCYPPCHFFRRSLYPNPSHAHPPQPLLFNFSLFYYQFLISSPPQTLSFHLPHFSVEANSFARQFAFVTLFSHPSFLCFWYPPCCFFRHSLYPNPNHAHPSQKLFSTSLFYCQFLLTPPPQILSFHLPHFSITKQKMFLETNSFGRPFAFVTPFFPIHFFVVLLSPMSFLSPLAVPKP